MNWFLLSKFLISFAGIPVSLYLTYTGLINYKRSKTKYTLYYIIAFALLAFALVVYTPTALLTKDQDLIAEFTLGGSFILMMIVLPIYIEYFHGIYKRVPYISQIFYYAVGGGFVTLFFQPWEIQYKSDFYGYCQCLSDITVFCLFTQFTCIFIIMFQTFRVIKTKVDIDFVNATQIFKENSDNQEIVLSLKDRKNNLKGKKRVLNYILLSYLIGICLIGIGFLISGSYWDSVGILVIVGPQAYFFSRDNDILVYLSAQKVREETMKLKKELNTLHWRSTTIPKNVEVEIESMVDFIEKADLILPHRNK